ncbi:MAG: VOC family protein [Bacteroidetes bacterium]|jgi:predicted 3-demethylubiquinone-9 3-methyltransferase (glyoxalase superfamily)|nr:VOC family protein [Bacteroidota bacterium]
MINPIYPCLWFNQCAYEAAIFYCSVFKDSFITGKNSMVVSFTLDGRKFMALNSGPNKAFTEAISLVIDCETQTEMDYYWLKLTENGGQEGRCGWLKDQFGVSWQVVPVILPRLLNNPLCANNVMSAMLKMSKLDIHALEDAAGL